MSEVVKIKMAVDPGWSGAVVVECNGETTVYDCPNTMAGISDLVVKIKGLPIIDMPSGISGTYQSCVVSVCYEAILEKVHSMPGMNCAASWTFAQNYSYWQAFLHANGIKYKEKTPQDWMKKLGGIPTKITVAKDADKKEKSRVAALNKKNRKNAILDQMQKLYPQTAVTLKNADALAMLSIFDRLWEGE